MKRLALLLASALVAAALPANAQTYPVRPIELISPTGAGGGSDLVARMVAEIISKEKLLPQPMVVLNKPGGGGAIGQTYAAGKRGDPYTVLLATTTLISVPVRTVYHRHSAFLVCPTNSSLVCSCTVSLG